MKPSLPISLTVAKAKCSNGVTLLELLVAMVILAIIVASVYTAFNSSKQSWQVGEIIVQKYQNARGALDMMSREISAMYITASSIYETGLMYENDVLRFTAPIPGNSGNWDMCKVGYRYQGGKLQRGFDVDPTLSNLNTINDWTSLVCNVNSLEFRWWDSNVSDFSSAPWDSTPGGSQDGEIPKAIEITITVQDDKQLAAEQTFKTVVYIPASEQ